MKNIMKIMLALLTSVSLVGSVNAGELTVTGSAKATYNMLSGGGTASKGQSRALGLTNEIDFGATGELDNGYTWKYQVQMDPGATTTAGGGGVDDTRLELTTGYGTLGVYVSEGGLDTDNSASQSVYGRPTDIGLSTGIVDGPGIGSFNNIQLHTPAGLLPYGISIKAAFAPGAQSGITSGNAKGVAQTGDFLGHVEQYQIKANPIDGLNIGGDYLTHSNQGTAVSTVTQTEQSGSLFATYSYGPASFGVSNTLVAPLILGTTATQSVQSNTATTGRNANAVRQVENRKMSVAYNVNENLSVSYEVEKSNRELIVNATENDIKSEAIQAAYTMGGMTLSVSRGETENTSYTTGNDTSQTLFAMSMVF